MKAFGVEAAGGVDALKELTLPKPEAKGKDILVEVKSVSINPVDTKKRKGAALGGAPTGPLVMGYDAAGVVVAVGEEVTMFSVGDEVFYAGAVQRQGTNAQYHLVDENIVAHKPRNISFAEAAAVPLVFLTAWEALVENLGINPGEGSGKSLLIIGGAGGVGSMASQLAKNVLHLGAVISTASRDESIAYCKAHGAEHTIDHKKPLGEELKRIGFEGGVDYVLCCVDLDLHFDAICDALKPMGKIAAITLSDPTKINVFKMFAKRLTLSFELMFTRALFNTADVVEQHNILDRAKTYIEGRAIKSTMTSEEPLTLENLKKAHEVQESGAMCGKQVLTW